jgi:hypothetical protein
VYCQFVIKPGQQVTFSVWTRGDGSNSGRYQLRDGFTSAILINTTSFAVPGTSYTQVQFTYTPAAGVCLLEFRLLCTAANGGICYYDDVSITAITDCTAAYSTFNTTYQQPGPPLRGILYSAKFLGAASAAYLGSGGYNALHNPDTGSVVGWMKVNAASVWTDASTLRYTWHQRTSPTLINTLFWKAYN